MAPVAVARVAWMYEAPNASYPFEEWFFSISDKLTRAKIHARVLRFETGNLGDCESLGEGVLEGKDKFGPGIRIYFGIDGKDIILLHGGTKRGQTRDIETAKERWKDYEKRKKRKKSSW